MSENRKMEPGGGAKGGTVLQGRYEVSGSGQGIHFGRDVLLDKKIVVAEYRPVQEIGTAAAGQTGDMQKEHGGVAGQTVDMQKEYGGAAESPTDYMGLARKFSALRGEEHLVQMLDVFEEDGGVYFVMEYLEGHALEELLAHHRVLKPERAVEYALQAAEALQKLHGEGTLYRFLCPENIWITPQGLVKLLFPRERRTAAGCACLAPEQVRGEAATAQSDVYALSAILYRMLAGTIPPEASARCQEDTAAALLKRRNCQAWRNAVLHGMELQPDRRTASVANLRRELQAGWLSAADGKRRRLAGQGWTLAMKLTVIILAAANLGLLAVSLRTPDSPAEPLKETELPEMLPCLVGMRYDEAEALLEQNGISLNRTEVVYAGKMEEDTILAQEPAEGTLLEANGTVNVKTATQEATWVRLASYEGVDAGQAEAALAAEGLQVTVRSEYSEAVAEGKVIATSPAAGERVDQASTVELVVSKGPAKRQTAKTVTGKTAEGKPSTIRIVTEENGYDIFEIGE